MQVDNLPKPDVLWFEDEDGNKIDVDVSHGMPDFPDGQKWYMHTKYPIVRHKINTCGVPDKWPVKCLKWVINKCPSNWKGNPTNVYASNTSISFSYPLVKYLVENRNWSFDEAVIMASNLCERCFNIACWSCEGYDYVNSQQRYLTNTRTYCRYCKYFDPDYDTRHRLWCCYRTFNHKGNVEKAWKQVTVDFHPDYFGCPDQRPNWMQRLKHKVKLVFDFRKGK